MGRFFLNFTDWLGSCSIRWLREERTPESVPACLHRWNFWVPWWGLTLVGLLWECGLHCHLSYVWWGHQCLLLWRWPPSCLALMVWGHGIETLAVALKKNSPSKKRVLTLLCDAAGPRIHSLLRWCCRSAPYVGMGHMATFNGDAVT